MENKKKSYTNNIIKVTALCLTFIISGVAYIFYNNWQYNNYITSLYNEFNSHNYDNAYNIYSNELVHIPFKKDTLQKDLSTYFTNVVSIVCDNLDDKKLSKEQALSIVNEINKYNVFGDSLQKLIASLEGKDTRFIGSNEQLFKEATKSYENKNYSDTILFLSNITTDYKKIDEIKSLASKCKEEYKSELINEGEVLAANKYYSKAIDLLDKADKNLIKSDDEDVTNKLKFYNVMKEEYLKYRHLEDSAYTSNAIMEPITEQNINTLDIASKTPYLVYVSMTEQKTYVYKGEKSKWKLEKSFPCSTGLPGKETPKGVFDVDERGEWFYSEKFAQGGKYYVQFLGDYLFHSLPYDKSGKNVVDHTLGVPSSHGCIRLNDADAKYLFDTITRNTKVILN